MDLSDYYRTAPIAKPEPRKRTKARKDRTEAKVKKAVRAACVERDGSCRYFIDAFNSPHFASATQCSGVAEWAHLENLRRARTRGMNPALRHTTAGTAMLCRKHRRAYDAGTLRIVSLTGRGADGPLQWRTS